MMNSIQSNRVKVFRSQGLFIVPAFVDEAQRADLRRVCDAALHDARGVSRETGHSTPRISVLWDADPKTAESIATFFCSRQVCQMLDGLSLLDEPPAPRLKDVHYYHEQTKQDWDGDWHRDSQFRRPDLELERKIISTTTTVHVRVALEDDDRLEIVPGSHSRWDTPEELRIRKGACRATPEMPNAVRIELSAGTGCVFHAWTVHRATYRREPVRRTLDAVFAFGGANSV
jgi:hypothetical protein